MGTAAGARSTERLSSGMRINRAGDDAAGLAISEKMRGQIRGLNQASSNAQDGISMIQTAEGALNETHSILQRMRELATQSANDTNVDIDRDAIQNEMNQLSSEINRIGNTTEFNSQKILKGAEESAEIRPALELDATELITGGNLTGGQTNDPENAELAIKLAAQSTDADENLTFNFGEEEFTVNVTANNGATEEVTDITANSATVALDSESGTVAEYAGLLKEALEGMVAENNNISDADFAITEDGTDTVTISALDGGEYAEGAGSIVVETDDADLWDGTATVQSDFGKNETFDHATENVAFSALTDDDAVEALVGQGMTINDQSIEFYNANEGAYTGEADFAVNISSVLEEASRNEALVGQIAEQLGSEIEGVTLQQDGTDASELVITATEGGEAGNDIGFTDGVDVAAVTSAETFTSTFQVGANTAQSMTVEINDMRSMALGVTGVEEGGEIVAKNGEEAYFTETQSVTDGTTNENVEYALDVSSHEKATAAVSVLNDAIETVSAQRSELGSFQNRLEHTISNLGTSSENLQAAESRIRDVDMAAEMMEFTKNNILQQAGQAMLAQANQAPQGVLQLLG